jgi:hypothetical protein
VADADHDEVTAVDLPGAVRLATGRVLPRIMCCNGAGFSAYALDPPYVTPCWCPAGKRLQCATPEDCWPLREHEAEAAAELIGLEVAA